MAKCSKLLEKARSSPGGLTYAQLKKLLNCFGFEYKRTSGGHDIWGHDGITGPERPVNTQPKKNKAKAYQVRQIVDLIDAYGLTDGSRDSEVDQ